MCGIVGVHSLTGIAKKFEPEIDKAVQTLSKRGPDSSGKFFHERVALGHTRLSIIDTSSAGLQPMQDSTGRYVIVFNGEIYNYKELRKSLIERGAKFHSHTDTEVLLNLYIFHGESFLEMLNGFFAFAIYDKMEGEIFLARDRMGIKPLLFYQDDEKLIFASEMKAIFAFNINKELDRTSIYQYLQLNYIPAPASILSHVRKIEPGHFMKISADGRIMIKRYYRINYEPVRNQGTAVSYEDAKAEVKNLLTESVKRRLIADVPLGAFLSGGIDSSVIVATASKFTEQLNTFSIGFKDEPYFDETEYANLVAKKFNTNHTVFSLTNQNLFEHLYDILNYIDEPFADSSAINVFILSKHTRSKVTVALSGDGADELFAGYNKHLAEYRTRNSSLLNFLVKSNSYLFKLLPSSRNNALSNTVRQINRYAEGLEMNDEERYWRWCTFINEQEAATALNVFDEPFENTAEYVKRKSAFLIYHKKQKTVNDTLFNDMRLVLPNDMLTKVDLMSMANGLEVRVPFLDHTLVDYVFSLPADFKIYKGFRKRILKDAFREDLPAELYKRPKKGFEVPLLKWFNNELKSLICDDLLSATKIQNQQIFNPAYVEMLKKRLFSSSPGEAVAQVWGLIVFQHWYKKYIE